MREKIRGNKRFNEMTQKELISVIMHLKQIRKNYEVLTGLTMRCNGETAPIEKDVTK